MVPLPSIQKYLQCVRIVALHHCTPHSVACNPPTIIVRSRSGYSTRNDARDNLPNLGSLALHHTSNFCDPSSSPNYLLLLQYPLLFASSPSHFLNHQVLCAVFLSPYCSARSSKIFSFFSHSFVVAFSRADKLRGPPLSRVPSPRRKTANHQNWRKPRNLLQQPDRLLRQNLFTCRPKIWQEGGTKYFSCSSAFSAPSYTLEVPPTLLQTTPQTRRSRVLQSSHPSPPLPQTATSLSISSTPPPSNSSTRIPIDILRRA
ncbi:hypothetical protein EJ06DRAFT_78345 [Trichodelitschia bisporula]|uniref:Uncharacterized protein n=1 Tax=Trichodelitschia bisporula TaxID=703511 RepID=A0A6G1HTT7_9PEZI|nr:hypothetical protein EJ06DRAFT_78345 [Trichodelitschia bisporula]